MQLYPTIKEDMSQIENNIRWMQTSLTSGTTRQSRFRHAPPWDRLTPALLYELQLNVVKEAHVRRSQGGCL